LNIENEILELRAVSKRLDELMRLQNQVARKQNMLLLARNEVTQGVRVIRDLVCTHYNLAPGAISMKMRTVDLVTARQLIWWLARRLTGATTTQLGQMFSRNHGTIISGMRAVEDHIAVEADFAATAAGLEKQCVLKLNRKAAA
jgi:chromosomal replication initiation ATPase DnaA